MSQIEVVNLDLGYEREAIIKGLNFQIEKGEYVAIVGENGSGKTTLMKTILGLIKPLNGKIILDPFIKDGIGYLPQQTNVQRDFPASVLEVCLSGFLHKTKLRPFYNKEEKRLAILNLEKMGLKGFEKRSYKELSGGQQQRVLLARALCASSEIMLLDEPVTGLDSVATEEMYNLIKSLNDEGMTIIMITHDLSKTIDYATHILHIGQEIFFGPKELYLKEGK